LRERAARTTTAIGPIADVCSIVPDQHNPANGASIPATPTAARSGSLFLATACTTACTCACTCACTSERPPGSFPVIVRLLVPIRQPPLSSRALADSAGFVNEKPPVSSCDIGGRQSGRGGSNSRHSAWEAEGSEFQAFVVARVTKHAQLGLYPGLHHGATFQSHRQGKHVQLTSVTAFAACLSIRLIA